MVLLLLLLAAPPAAPSPAHVVDVVVEGEGAFFGDVDSAVREAKRDARRRAVERALEHTTKHRSMTQNYRIVADEIAAASKGVLINESWSEPITSKTLKLTLTAKLDLTALEDATCTVIRANHDPKVTLVTVEKVRGEPWSNEGPSKALVRAAFVDACFSVEDKQLAEVSANGDPSHAALAQLVKESNAQYVALFATRRLQRDEPDADQRMVISMTAKLINTSINQIEAVSSKQKASPTATITDSLVQQDVINPIMDDLMKKIAARFEGGCPVSSRIQVVVHAVPNLATAKAFRATIAALLPGAKLEERVVKNGQASYDLDVDGGAELFAERTEGKAVGKQHVIEVLEVSRSKVILKLVKQEEK